MIYELLKNGNHQAFGSFHELTQLLPIGSKLQVGRNRRQQINCFQWNSPYGEKFIIQKLIEVEVNT